MVESNIRIIVKLLVKISMKAVVTHARPRTPKIEKMGKMT